MVVISSVVSVISLSALGLLAELVVSSIVRSLCFPFDFAWFHRALLRICFLVDCGFSGVSGALLPLNARHSADFAVLAVCLIRVFGSISSRYSSSSISCFSVRLSDFSPDRPPSSSSGDSPPFPMRSVWGTNATFTTPVRSKTTTYPPMLASCHAIPAKASIDAGKHRSLSFPFLVNNCSNRLLVTYVLFLSPGPPVCGEKRRVEDKTDWRNVTDNKKRDNDEENRSWAKTNDYCRSQWNRLGGDKPE